MKNKLSILYIGTIILIVSTFLTSCGKSKNPEKVIDYLKDLKSYKCDITMEIKNSRQNLNYVGKQYYSNNKGVRLEINEDRVLIYKDKNIFVNDVKNNTKYSTDESYDKIYKLSFIKNFVDLIYSNESIKTYFKKLDNREYEIIELEVPSDNLNVQKLHCILAQKIIYHNGW